MPTYKITKPYTIKSKPIIFNAEMVRAILEGRKTQTRRVIPSTVTLQGPTNRDPDKNNVKEKTYPIHNSKGEPIFYRIPSPHGDSGDFLWVRESIIKRDIGGYANAFGATYAADFTPVMGEGPQGSYIGRAVVDWKWKRDVLPSIFMPRWASRITLKITEIRVQQIRQISYNDVIKEGTERDHPNVGQDLRRKFMDLWDSINAKRGYSWESNPWVWAITFERIDEGATDEDSITEGSPQPIG